MKFSIGLASVAFAALTAAPSQADVFIVNHDRLNVIVDMDACDNTSLTLCSGTGSTSGATASNNAVAIVHVHVHLPNGSPISGLTQSDFRLTAITNGGSGVTPGFVASATCGACFAEPEPGVYRLAARPTFGDWGDGSYVTLLDVSIPSGNTRQTIIPFEAN